MLPSYGSTDRRVQSAGIGVMVGPPARRKRLDSGKASVRGARRSSDALVKCMVENLVVEKSVVEFEGTNSSVVKYQETFVRTTMKLTEQVGSVFGFERTTESGEEER